MEKNFTVLNFVEDDNDRRFNNFEDAYKYFSIIQAGSISVGIYLNDFFIDIVLAKKELL